MAEQSHLDAMREAIKGDLERARARRPSIFERPAPPPVEIREQSGLEPPPPSNSPLQGSTGPEPPVEPVVEPVVEPDVEPVIERVPDPQLAGGSPALRRGLLSRLAFWR